MVHDTRLCRDDLFNDSFLSMMERLRSARIIAGLIVAILMIAATSIAIWNFFAQPYRLEAYAISVRAPMPPKLEQTLKDLSKFSLKDIRERAKREASFPPVGDNVLAAAIPAFSWIIDRRLFLVLEGVPRDHLTVFTVRNSGNKTVRNVQLRVRSALEDVAIIDGGRGQRRGEIVKFDGILNLGDMPPGLDINIFVYSLLPFFPFESVVAHDEGLIPIWEYRPVPPFTLRTGGFFVPYFQVIVVVFGIVTVCLLTVVIFLLVRRRSTVGPQ